MKLFALSPLLARAPKLVAGRNGVWAQPQLAQIHLTQSRRRKGVNRARSRALRVKNLMDYTAGASDDGVLRLPGRTELDPSELKSVFGYPRNFLDRYYLGKVIGAGSFGVVRECYEIVSGARYAAKSISKIPKRGPPTPRYLLKLRTEVEVMQQLGTSLNAVNLRDVFEDDTSTHLIMELCDGGALLERVEGQKYSEAYIARLVRSILRFIAQCHAKGIIYRDVKPDNFLFLTKEHSSPLKATDFGLSIRHSNNEAKLTSRSGTPAYMAPELVMQCYDEKCDVWSVGMLAYQLLTGRFPFWADVRNQTLSEVWKAILTHEIDWQARELTKLSISARDFLERLLQRNPVTRPTAAAALEHSWVREEGTASEDILEGSVVQRLQRFATYTHLKQVVLKMIVEDMKKQGQVLPTHSVALENLFKTIDTDHSGSISFDELAEGLQSQGYIVTPSEVAQLMQKVDLDQDGNIGSDEFLTSLVDWGVLMKDKVWEDYLNLAFKRMDVDGDGFISLEELLQKLPDTYFGSSQGQKERTKEAKRMLREADENGDGKISKKEFFHLLHNNNTPDNLSMYDDRMASSILLNPEPVR